MDDLILYAKNPSQLGWLIQSLKIHSVIALVWGLTMRSAPCRLLRGKATQSAVIMLPNHTSIRSLKEDDRRMLALRSAGGSWNVTQSDEGKDQEMISPNFCYSNIYQFLFIKWFIRILFLSISNCLEFFHDYFFFFVDNFDEMKAI